MSFNPGNKLSATNPDSDAQIRHDALLFKIHYASILLTGMESKKRKLKKIRSCLGSVQSV